MIKVRDDREAVALIEKFREEHGVSVGSIIYDLGITRNHFNRMLRTGHLSGNKVGFIAKLSAVLGDDILIGAEGETSSDV